MKGFSARYHYVQQLIRWRKWYVIIWLQNSVLPLFLKPFVSLSNWLIQLVKPHQQCALLIQIMLQRGPVPYNQQLNWLENNNTPANEFLPMNSPIRHLQLERDLKLFWHLMKNAEPVTNKICGFCNKREGKIGKYVAVNFHEQFRNVTNDKYVPQSYGIIWWFKTLDILYLSKDRGDHKLVLPNDIFCPCFWCVKVSMIENPFHNCSKHKIWSTGVPCFSSWLIWWDFNSQHFPAVCHKIVGNEIKS